MNVAIINASDVASLFDDPPLDLDYDPTDEPLADRQDVEVKKGKTHDTNDGSQLMRQRCGGGFRVIRKRIGSN